MAATLSHETDATGNAFTKRAWGWTTFEFARNPYFMIILMYLFAPYAAGILGNALISDEVRAGLSPEEIEILVGSKGQFVFGLITTIAGIVSAITTPFLGAALDQGVRRKPLMAIVLLGLGLCAFSLWWVQPDNMGWSVVQTMAIFALGSALYNYTEVLHNSQLSIVAHRKSVPYVSGIGLALGNLAVVFLFAGLVLFFIAPAMQQVPFGKPLFGIDPATQEHIRIAGPAVAAWLVLFIAPYFIWTTDGGIKGTKWGPALKKGFSALKATISNARDHKEALKFLLARMLYADGMSTALYLGNIFLALFLGWHALEMAAYAFCVSVFAFMGGLLGGFLDRWFGPRNALILEISTLFILAIFQLSITRDTLFYGLVDNVQIWDGAVFSTLSDQVYLSLALVLAMFGTAMISSSRSMLVHVAPKEKIGEFFGLYMIVGTITSWIGPLAVTILTAIFVDQRAGMAILPVLFLGGLIGLFFVDAPKEKADV